MSNKQKNKIIKFLNGKVFYIVLCVCFLGVGVAAWAGVEGMKLTSEAEKNNNSSGLTAELPNIFDHPSSGISTPDDPSVPDISSESAVTPETPDKPTESETETAGGTVAAFFIRPVLGETLKDFSDTELQYSMTYNDMRLHKALDIAAAAGTPVTACGEGKVTDVYTNALWGTVVEIDHGNNVTVKYCGLNGSPSVKKGDVVDSSTQIGAVDVIPCESVEPRHLHIEFYLDGKAVSPSKYFTEH